MLSLQNGNQFAGDRGEIAAMENLARLYRKGQGVKQDFGIAARNLRRFLDIVLLHPPDDEFWKRYHDKTRSYILRSAHPPLIIPEFPLVPS